MGESLILETSFLVDFEREYYRRVPYVQVVAYHDLLNRPVDEE